MNEMHFTTTLSTTQERAPSSNGASRKKKRNCTLTTKNKNEPIKTPFNDPNNHPNAGRFTSKHKL